MIRVCTSVAMRCGETTVCGPILEKTKEDKNDNDCNGP